MSNEVTSVGPDRRTVLKAIGGMAGSSVVASSIVSADPDSRSEFVGVSYDSLTQRVQGDASATVVKTRDGIKGTLEFGGFTIPFDERAGLEDAEFGPKSTFVGRKQARRFTADGTPLDFDLVFYEGGLAGRATRPSGDYGHIGFTLGEKDREAPLEFPEKAMSENPITPEGHDVAPDVPSEGIPQNTSMRSILREVERNE